MLSHAASVQLQRSTHRRCCGIDVTHADTARRGANSRALRKGRSPGAYSSHRHCHRRLHRCCWHRYCYLSRVIIVFIYGNGKDEGCHNLVEYHRMNIVLIKFKPSERDNLTANRLPLRLSLFTRMRRFCSLRCYKIIIYNIFVSRNYNFLL